MPMDDVPPRAAGLAPDAPAATSPQGLADRATLALFAIERTHMPMVVSDPHQPDNPIILANGAFLKLTGYNAEEVIGRNCRFLQGPGTSPDDIAAIRDAVAVGVEVTREMRNYRKDGSEFWNQLHISPIHDDDGDVLYHFASQLDVTDRRKAYDLELAEHALLKEVDHRAKNALALVQGIVRLSRADDPAEYSRAVQGRVDALADAHVMLADCHWKSVPLDLLVKRRMADAVAGQVELFGPKIEVDVAQAQPLALLLHELIGNAAKHGALSSPDGTLTISWEGAPETVTIETVETGGPRPVRAQRQGFGLTIIEAIAVRQLRGKLSLDWRPEGLVSRIELPRYV